MPIVVPICAQLFGWRYSMLVPGMIGIAAGFALMFCLRDTPQSMGLPPVEKYRSDYPTGKPNKPDKKISGREILFEYVLRNKFIWILAFASFFV